jgi:hypothetical protein
MNYLNRSVFACVSPPSQSWHPDWSDLVFLARGFGAPGRGRGELGAIFRSQLAENIASSESIFACLSTPLHTCTFVPLNSFAPVC